MRHVSALLFVTTLFASGGSTAGSYTPRPSPPTDGRLGSNYTPSYAVNPIKGYHNGRWAACPQDRHRKPAHREALQAYVQDIVGKYRSDQRVLFWETFNEPQRRNAWSRALVADGYRWAKELQPCQPVICCWDDHPHTDIVDAHNYSSAAARWDRQAELNPKKGTVFTEAGTRWYPGRPRSHGTPVEVVRWLTTRKAAGKSQPGAFLCWELMVGHSNCRWVWGTQPGAPEPTIPWCGLLWPDATPVSLAESEACRRYATGKGHALFFDDFNPGAPAGRPSRRARPGWERYGPGRRSSLSGWLELGPHEKHVAGNAEWTDYVIEAKVMLNGEGANAGLILRVNDPGDGMDQMRGYYAGFDTTTLYLGKMNNNWRELARFDLGTLECSIRPGAWNLLRVEARGPRLRVRLNRMHGEPSKGLRIDHTDA
ncbi:MAG: family 16 glycoside hydrolase [Planctomycetota bacterium]